MAAAVEKGGEAEFGGKERLEMLAIVFCDVSSGIER
jgi:hypothetical protein